MLIYNKRVTGNLLTLPYVVHEATYGASPLFVWSEPLRVPDYRHAAMRAFHTDCSLWWYQAQRDWPGFLRVKGRLLCSAWKFLLGPVLTVPLFFIIGSFRRWSTRFALAVGGVTALAATGITWLEPHYLAPALPLLWLLVVQGFRQLAACQRGGKFVGRHVLAGLVLVYLAVFACKAYFYITATPEHWSVQRSQLVERLQDTPGRHLVVVRYTTKHDASHHEWVYNAADIDQAKIVWAREMSPQDNQQLLGYFHNRRAWLLEADASPPRLIEHVRRLKSPGPTLSPSSESLPVAKSKLSARLAGPAGTRLEP